MNAQTKNVGAGERARGLYSTLNARKRPEDVAEMVVELVGDRFSRKDRALIDRAARRSVKRKLLAWTSMLEDFQRPDGLERQVAVASALFTNARTLSADECSNVAVLESLLRELNAEIVKGVGCNEFKFDRLNRAGRASVGLELSKRRYNKLFRLLGRMERKLSKLRRELVKLELTKIGKSGLVSRLSWEEFTSDEDSAAFIAYFTARSNLRSKFTIAGQAKPYDEIADMLFERCLRRDSTNWFAIAHVFPNDAVLSRLDDAQRGELLGIWFGVLGDAARLLEGVWQNSNIDYRTMIVRRGNDSTTWNNTASAFNAARRHWIALLHAMGLDAMLDEVCPGKVLRLMAADVVAWHRSTGGGLDPDTLVFNDLPAPWLVLDGRATCTRAAIEASCVRHGIDPHKRGWTAPAPLQVDSYRPTPELVHGVSVSSPGLARVLRGAGWFSGKSARSVQGLVTVQRNEQGFAEGASGFAFTGSRSDD